MSSFRPKPGRSALILAFVCSANLWACSGDERSAPAAAPADAALDAAADEPDGSASLDAAGVGRADAGEPLHLDAGAKPARDVADVDAGADRDAGAPRFLNPEPGGPLFLGANLWNIDWEGAEDYFAPDTDWARTKNPWNPQFLKDIAPYHALRFMDWNLINETENPQAVWSSRKLPDVDQSTSPVAFEWQIDLCNRAAKDYWINIPHAASPDYVTQLAKLVYEQLDPRLRVYVEWSNEIWNGGFPQREYARARGEELGLTGDDKAFAYQVYQSVRVFEAFEAFFGKDSGRVVKVISGQAANWGVCEHHLAAFDDPTINPEGTRPDVYAIAPYFSGATLAELTGTGIPEAASWVTDTYRCADLAKLKVIAYEGGQDSYVAAGGALPCSEVQMLAGMRGTYVDFLDAMRQAGLKGPLMQYTHSGYCWGMKLKTSDAVGDSPKYQGMLDWLGRNP